MPQLDPARYVPPDASRGRSSATLGAHPPARSRALPAACRDGGARRARRPRRPARGRGRPAAGREAMLAELLPSVGGLHGLAGDGPRALADRRLGPVPALRAGRRSTLVQAPLGVVGVHVRDGSPWAGPLLRGRRRAARRQRRAARPGRAARRRPDPGRVRPRRRTRGAAAGGSASRRLESAARVVALDPPAAKGTMLVLDGAPLDRVVSGAVWAAFAGGGRRHAALGRVIVLRPLSRPRWRSGSRAPRGGCASATRAAPTPRSARCRAPPSASASRRSSHRPRKRARRGCAGARSSSQAPPARSTRRSCSAP